MATAELGKPKLWRVGLAESHDLRAIECVKWRLLLIIDNPNLCVAALDSRLEKLFPRALGS